MKTRLITLTLIFTSVINAQDITGQWNGLLKIQGTQLRVVFNISKTDSEYSSTMDSPDQGAKGIPVTLTTFENSTLKIEISNAKIVYVGILDKENNFIGDFKQAGQSFPMNLYREKIEKEKITRPQEPIKPYPYYSEKIKFENTTDKITLAGTLTLPEPPHPEGTEGRRDANYPVVVLITGSGPQNRDEELLGHKPFLVLADYLTKNGIGVLRFDDRGTGESTGDFKTATSLDFASDVESAVNYLLTRKEINKKKLGLIGHSEGGIIAPIVAAKSKGINFVVLLAGTGIMGNELLLLQQELIGKASGANNEELQKAKKINKGAFDIIIKSSNSEILKTELTNYIQQTIKDIPESERPSGMSEKDFVNQQVNQLSSPWMQFFIKYDPSIILKEVKCAVLALNGSKDLQVPSTINLETIKKGLEKGGNKKVTIKELPNLNHLFQECQTGTPQEYSKIEQTFSPLALTTILNWIVLQTK